MRLVLFFLASLYIIGSTDAHWRLWNNCPGYSDWNIIYQRCSPECPAFYVWDWWTRQCIVAGPQNCNSSQYWDRTNGRCIRSPCSTIQYYDQSAGQCRYPNCYRDNYFDKQTEQCRPCPRGQRPSTDSIFKCEILTDRSCGIGEKVDRIRNRCERHNCYGNQYFDDSIKQCSSCFSKKVNSSRLGCE